MSLLTSALEELAISQENERTDTYRPTDRPLPGCEGEAG